MAEGRSIRYRCELTGERIKIERGERGREKVGKMENEECDMRQKGDNQEMRNTKEREQPRAVGWREAGSLRRRCMERIYDGWGRGGIKMIKSVLLDPHS